MLVLFAPPLAVGVGAFVLFDTDNQPTAYEAEGRLEVVLMPGDSMQQALHRTAAGNRHSRDLAPWLTSDKVLRLVGFVLTREKLAGGHADSMVQKLPLPLRRHAWEALDQRLSQLQVTWSEEPGDSLIRLLMRRWDYHPEALRRSYRVTSLSATALLVKATAAGPYKARVRVELLCQQFDRYYKAVWQERLEEELLLRRNWVRQTRQQWEERQRALSREQARLRGPEADATMRHLLMQIGALEVSRAETSARVERLRARLQQSPQAAPPANSQPIIRTAYRAAPEAWLAQASRRALTLQLTETLSRLQALDQQLQRLRKALAAHEAQALGPFYLEANQAKATYETALAAEEAVVHQLRQLPQSLRLPEAVRVRRPHPGAPFWLGGLFAVTSFLLWGIFLLQIGYFRRW